MHYGDAGHRTKTIGIKAGTRAKLHRRGRVAITVTLTYAVAHGPKIVDHRPVRMKVS